MYRGLVINTIKALSLGYYICFYLISMKGFESYYMIFNWIIKYMILSYLNIKFFLNNFFLKKH